MANIVAGDMYHDLDGQLHEIKRQLRQLNGYPFNPYQLRIALQDAIEGRFHSGLENVIIDWNRVYKALGMKFEPGELAVEPDPLHWDVYVQKGVTPNKVVAAFRKLGVDVYTFVDNLDKGVPDNDRDPVDGSYRVRFRKTIEADPELADKSAENLKSANIAGITLLERLLLELGYFLVTGGHLDVENVTLCSGSRRSGGSVPLVYWLAVLRELYVHWCYPQSRIPYLRSRAVVSLPAEATA